MQNSRPPLACPLGTSPSSVSWLTASDNPSNDSPWPEKLLAGPPSQNTRCRAPVGQCCFVFLPDPFGPFRLGRRVSVAAGGVLIPSHLRSNQADGARAAWWRQVTRLNCHDRRQRQPAQEPVSSSCLSAFLSRFGRLCF